MEVDIKNMTASELLALRSRVDLRLNDLAKGLEEQLLQIRGSASADGQPAQRKQARIGGRKLSPKYRNPVDPSQTWAGRGKRPKWLTSALAAGKKLESFAIRK